jgi:hypothetical protein
MEKSMIEFTEIPDDGEIWELFARDFLQEIGFFVESSPDRGPDGGKDLIVTEDLKGNLGNYKFRWLVSCKHFALGNKSVQERDELNILERVEAYSADGFIGFYSTVPSSGLNTRLNDLKANGRIKDYKIFDQKSIENYLVRIGFSGLLARYFPISYKIVKPLHILFDEYIPLYCDACEKDILQSLYKESYNANIVFSIKGELINGKFINYVDHIYCCCKGSCDRILKNRYERPDEGFATYWENVSDLIIPSLFLHRIMIHMNTLREGTYIYTAEAFEKMKTIITSLAQKSLRELTVYEQERVKDILSLSM